MANWECHPVRNFYQDLSIQSLEEGGYGKTNSRRKRTGKWQHKATHLFLRYSQVIYYLLGTTANAGREAALEDFSGQQYPQKINKTILQGRKKILEILSNSHTTWTATGIFPELVCIMCVQVSRRKYEALNCVCGGDPSAFAFSTSCILLFLCYRMSVMTLSL